MNITLKNKTNFNGLYLGNVPQKTAEVISENKAVQRISKGYDVFVTHFQESFVDEDCGAVTKCRLKFDFLDSTRKMFQDLPLIKGKFSMETLIPYEHNIEKRVQLVDDELALMAEYVSVDDFKNALK